MNLWVKKSIELAKSDGYLDKLHGIYPMEVSAFREIPSELLDRINNYLVIGDSLNLIKTLLHKKIEVFPIKDSYIAFFRSYPSSIEANPETVDRIGKRLIAMGFDEIVRMSTLPKETNRQIGPMFRRWIPNLGYPVLKEGDFLNFRGTAFLEGTDTSLKNFANRNLGTKLEKGLDLVLKVGDQFILGESKFLSAYGGHQNAQFNDPLGLLKGRGNRKIIKIAVLDGVVWIPSNNQMFTRVSKSTNVIISALLLNEFITSLEKNTYSA